MARSDEELLRACRTGSPEAFNVLMLRWHSRILNFAYHFLGNADDARDVCQEVFVRAYLGIGTVKAHSRFASWLHRIALNLCIDRKRRLQVRQRALPGAEAGSATSAEVDGVPDRLPSPSERVERDETSDLVADALQSLPGEQRTPVIMRHYLGMSFPEIASALDRPVTTVKSRVYAGLSALKEKLADVGLLEWSEAP